VPRCGAGDVPADDLRRQAAARLHAADLQAAALATEAELAMLRYQVNPHFLFNSLNSLRALIDESPAAARTMVTQLAELFRHSLRTTKNELTVNDEVTAIRNYLDIQKIRFDDGSRRSRRRASRCSPAFSERRARPRRRYHLASPPRRSTLPQRGPRRPPRARALDPLHPRRRRLQRALPRRRQAHALSSPAQRMGGPLFPQSFLRIHRTAIVHLDHVDTVLRISDQAFQVSLRGLPDPAPLSRRHAARLKSMT
jgi:hypothetical protein